MTAFARGGELCSQLSIIAKAEPHCGNTDKQGIGKKCKNCSAIGVDPTITIHEREDSANLLNLVRHELGLSGRLTAAVRCPHLGEGELASDGDGIASPDGAHPPVMTHSKQSPRKAGPARQPVA